MNQQDKCVEVYRQKLLIHHVAEEMNLPWHVVYRHLKRAGALDIETRMVVGGRSDRMGAFYEKKFQTLVPQAICQNDKKRKYLFDFLVGDAKVEIKSSSLYCDPSGRRHWKFQVMTRRTKTRNADYYVCFGRNDSEDPNNYTLFCFPVEFLRGGNVNVSLDARNEWAKFKIEPEDLASFFEDEEIANAG